MSFLKRNRLVHWSLDTKIYFFLNSDETYLKFCCLTDLFATVRKSLVRLTRKQIKLVFIFASELMGSLGIFYLEVLNSN